MKKNKVNLLEIYKFSYMCSHKRLEETNTINYFLVQPFENAPHST